MKINTVSWLSRFRFDLSLFPVLMFKIKCVCRKEANLNSFDIKVCIQYREPSSKFFFNILGRIH